MTLDEAVAKWAPTFVPPRSHAQQAAPSMLAFSDSEDEVDMEPTALTTTTIRQVKMTDDIERQLEELERMQDDLERQSSQQGAVQQHLSEEDFPILEPQSSSPASEPWELDGPPSPSISPVAQLEHERRQVRDLTRALATERRARRDLSGKLDELHRQLLLAEEEKHDATERAQQIEEDYLSAQMALSKADSEQQSARRNSRALAEKLRKVEGQPGGIKLPAQAELLKMSSAELDELEETHSMGLAAVRVAKEAVQRAEYVKLQRECENLSEARLCAVCMAADADATFVHGDSGHQACCHSCAIQVYMYMILY